MLQAKNSICIYTLSFTNKTQDDSHLLILSNTHLWNSISSMWIQKPGEQGPIHPFVPWTHQPNPHRKLWLQASLTTAQQVAISTFGKKLRSAAELFGSHGSYQPAVYSKIQTVWKLRWQNPTFIQFSAFRKNQADFPAARSHIFAAEIATAATSELAPARS